MAMWNQTSTSKKATIDKVNDRYRFQIHELWMGRNGMLVPGNLAAEGYGDTLEDAKRQVFEFYTVWGH